MTWHELLWPTPTRRHEALPRFTAIDTQWDVGYNPGDLFAVAPRRLIRHESPRAELTTNREREGPHATTGPHVR
jgi:hypothetical protein